MKMILYIINGSPPCTSVLIVAKALDVPLDIREIDLENKEQLSEAFLIMNPTQTVPVLDDNGFFIWDSHAIVCYLAEAYAKNDSLYPKDLKGRTKINQLLYLDCGTLFRRFSDVTRPIFFTKEKSLPFTTKLPNLEETYLFLERLLNKSRFLVSDNVSLADLTLISVVICSNVVLGINGAIYPKLSQWIVELKSLPCFEAGVKSLKTFETGFKVMLKQIEVPS